MVGADRVEAVTPDSRRLVPGDLLKKIHILSDHFIKIVEIELDLVFTRSPIITTQLLYNENRNLHNANPT